MKTSALPNGVGVSNGPEYGARFSRWFRYPAGFSADSLEACREEVGEECSTVIDPFAGVGTAGVALAASGIRFAGIEAHPEIAELASLKFHQPSASPGLTVAAQKVVNSYTSVKDFSGEAEAVRKSFAPTALSELLGLRNRIKKSRTPWRAHLKWALLATLRDLATARVGWPYQRPGLTRKPRFRDPVARFLQRASFMADDLNSWAGRPSDVFIATGDSRTLRPWNEVQAAGFAPVASISSPPYLNNFDYADATRLELYFWGIVTTWADLVLRVRSDMLQAATHQTSVGRASKARKQLGRIPQLGQVVENADALEVERLRRNRGKEYDRLILCYFSDILRVLDQLGRTLPAGAPCAWVVGDSAPYGVYINTPDLILKAADYSGFEATGDYILRERGLRWGTNGTRHQVGLTERLITFRKIT